MTDLVVRTAFGFMDTDKFLAFLGEGPSFVMAVPAALGVALGLAFVGGIVSNLTPCVLPMVPVNLSIIGRRFVRGLVYALGQALVCGSLGIAAALGGYVFGAIHTSRVFNAALAFLMVALALCLFDVLHLDLSRFRRRTSAVMGVFGVLMAGGVSALMASACVAPALAAVLVTTADGVASGDWRYGMLPFAYGLGLGLPWPFLAAGIGRLPKPGVWMVHLKRAMGLGVVALACIYGYRTLRPAAVPSASSTAFAADFSKPRLYMLSSPSCTYCHRMEATTLKDDRVVSALSRFDVRPLMVEDENELRRHPELNGVNILGFPAYVIVFTP